MVSREIVLKFLHEKGATRPCPSCGHNHWFLADKEEDFSAQLLVRSEASFTIPPSHVPLIVLVCNNCAFIRVYAKMVVRTWALEKGFIQEEQARQEQPQSDNQGGDDGQ